MVLVVVADLQQGGRGGGGGEVNALARVGLKSDRKERKCDIRCKPGY